MKTALQTPSKTQAPQPTAAQWTASLVHQRCVCGMAAEFDTRCGDCRRQGLVGKKPLLVQPKLKIGRSDDKYEQEANRMAEQVMRMPEPVVQPKLTSGGKNSSYRDENEVLRTKSLVRNNASNSGVEAPAIVQQMLDSPGQPLDLQTRGFMEKRFGHDFSQVRVHTNSNAAESAASINARAYTVGQNVVFSPNQYSPDTSRGQKLIAHELVHVVQQKWATHGINQGEISLGNQTQNSQLLQCQKGETLEASFQLPTIDFGRPPMPWELEPWEIRSEHGRELFWNLLNAWNSLELFQEQAQYEIKAAHAIATRLQNFIDCSDELSSVTDEFQNLVFELNNLNDSVNSYTIEEMESSITDNFKRIGYILINIDPVLQDIEAGYFRGCISTRLSPFADGVFKGLKEFGDEEMHTLLLRYSQSALFNSLFPHVLIAGAIVGIAEDVRDFLIKLFETVLSPIEAIRKFDETLETFGELFNELSGLSGDIFAEKLGHGAGQAIVGEARKLNAAGSVAKFSFELGRLIGPIIVYTVLSMLGIEAAIAGRIISLGRSALSRLRGLKAFSRLKRQLPDIPVDTLNKKIEFSEVSKVDIDTGTSEATLSVKTQEDLMELESPWEIQTRFIKESHPEWIDVKPPKKLRGKPSTRPPLDNGRSRRVGRRLKKDVTERTKRQRQKSPEGVEPHIRERTPTYNWKSPTEREQMLGLEFNQARKELNKSLLKALGRKPFKHAAGHHIIPWQYRNHEVIIDSLMEGWNINSAHHNGIYLPTRPNIKGAGKRSIHNDFHPKYNQKIKVELDKIAETTKTYQQRRQHLENLVNKFRESLEKGTEPLE